MLGEPSVSRIKMRIHVIRLQALVVFQQVYLSAGKLENVALIKF